VHTQRDEPSQIDLSPFLYPIIAKILTVGAAFSRDSRLEGAPTKRCQKLTSGEFQKQHKNSHCIL
jgi:hypothetical protein